MGRRSSARFSVPAKRFGFGTSWTVPASRRGCASACSTRFATADFIEKVENNRYRLTMEIRRRKKYRFGYAGQGQDSSFAHEVHSGLVRAAERAEVELVVVDNRYQPKIAVTQRAAADPRGRRSRHRVSDRRSRRARDRRRRITRRAFRSSPSTFRIPGRPISARTTTRRG